jgi:hypothetical protein
MAFPTLALAQAPVREKVSIGSFVAESSCAFPVSIDPSLDQFTILTFGDGRQIVTGTYVATATNLDTGKSVDINLSGQSIFNPETGVFSTTGTTLLVDEDALLLVHGPIIFDAEGRTIISGSVTDMCAVLSDP